MYQLRQEPEDEESSCVSVVANEVSVLKAKQNCQFGTGAFLCEALDLGSFFL